VLSIFTYTYDNAGNRTAVVEANGDRVTWSYDEIYQLTAEERSGDNGYAVVYTYDAVGNRLVRDEDPNIVTYSYDAANQLTVEQNPSARTTYSYDANGNTQVINAAGSLTTNTWDIENRMTLAELPGGGRNTITYDGDGKRRSFEDSVMLRNFLWDGENIARQTSSDGSTNRRYTYHPQAYGELISQDGPTFHHYDGLGSTDRLTDASQNTVISYLYRAFGEQTVLSGSNPNRFTWVGRLGYYRQPDSSDYWMRARIYRPTIGRWVSRDRLASISRYGYVENDPLLLVDPEGKQILPFLPPPVRGRLEAEWRGLFGWIPQGQPGLDKYRRCWRKCLSEEIPTVVAGETFVRIAKKVGWLAAKTARLGSVLGWIATGISIADCMDKCMNPGRRPCPKPKALGREPTLPQAGYGYTEDSYGRRLYY